jgi:hypothetical protein
MAEVNTTQMRDALAWATNDKEKAKEPSTNPIVWFWEAIEGDFNEDRTTAQLLTDAAISMIPLVDQICDLRDLIANCKKLSHDYKDKAAWLALVLTLIGLFPTLGSLLKGVLKIIFAHVRRAGIDQAAKAVERGMSWVIVYLRREEVQKYIKSHKIDRLFAWLATGVKELRGRVNTKALLAAFDTAISTLEVMVNKVRLVPTIYRKAKAALEQAKEIRLAANQHMEETLKPVHDILTTIILNLERRTLEREHAILNASNIHFCGALPEADAITLMRQHQPPWLSKTGDTFFAPANATRHRPKVDMLSAKVDAAGNARSQEDIFPYLTDQNIESFHTLQAHTIKGPARLYRILAPNSRGMSDCWVSEEVFNKLQNSPNPKEAWRRYLAVWPDWNVNGQFVIYDVKAGESLNVWRGPASSQKKDGLPDNFLEGGWEQIVFKIERTDPRNDTLTYYELLKSSKGTRLGPPLTQVQVDHITVSMDQSQKADFLARHIGLRQQINHPNISGPFDTGWGYTEFDGVWTSDKIGLPALPGQATAIAKGAI